MAIKKSERYATPLPKLAQELEALAVRVNAHLARIGTQGQRTLKANID